MKTEDRGLRRVSAAKFRTGGQAQMIPDADKGLEKRARAGFVEFRIHQT